MGRLRRQPGPTLPRARTRAVHAPVFTSSTRRPYAVHTAHAAHIANTHKLDACAWSPDHSHHATDKGMLFRSVPFVGEVLGKLREAVAGSGATVLGFVGLPFTLGSYLVEGATGTKNGFANFRALRESDPELCRDILDLLAQHISDYAIYQIDAGAQVIQVFDSWAGHLEPAEFDEWAAPYQKRVVSAIKERRPEVPVIIYMAPDTHSRGGALLERLAASGADVISLDHTIDLADARQRLADAGYESVGLQGNLDPEVLRDGPPEAIVSKAEQILKSAGDTGHVMNLGHGIEVWGGYFLFKPVSERTCSHVCPPQGEIHFETPRVQATTPEPYADLFVKTVQGYKH